MLVSHLHLWILVLYEGENTAMYNSVAESINTGFSGNGYANFYNETGSSIEFAVCVSENNKNNLIITFSNGTSAARPISVSVNGSVVINSLGFDQTGSWTVWNKQAVSVDLQKGINTIKFISLSSDGGPNVDNIKLENSLLLTSEPHMANLGVQFNPTGYIIRNGSPGKSVQVVLYAINGKIVLSRNLIGVESFKLPVHYINNGRYVLELTSDNISRVQMLNIVK